VRNGKGLESGDVIAGFERLLGDSPELTLQRRDDLLQLALDVGGVELVEDHADGGRDHRGLAPGTFASTLRMKSTRQRARISHSSQSRNLGLHLGCDLDCISDSTRPLKDGTLLDSAME
jgi:hypothetical protein